jgi:hypothetical protein
MYYVDDYSKSNHIIDSNTLIIIFAYSIIGSHHTIMSNILLITNQHVVILDRALVQC